MKFLIFRKNASDISNTNSILSEYGECDICQNEKSFFKLIEQSDNNELPYNAAFIDADIDSPNAIRIINKIKCDYPNTFEKLKFVILVNGESTFSVLKLFTNSKYKFIRMQSDKNDIVNILHEMNILD